MVNNCNFTLADWTIHLFKNGNFTLLLTYSGKEWQFHICYLTYSGQEWKFHIATGFHWSRMAVSHCSWHIVVKNGNFTLLLDIHWWRMAISHCYLHIVVKNGNFTLLLASKGQEWQFHISYWHMSGQQRQLHITTDSHSGQEWQFHIATDIWVVNKGNFTLLLTSNGQEWQFHIAPDIH